MTILNITNDGLYPELITIFRVVAHLGKADSNVVLESCYPGTPGEHSNTARLSAVLSRWSDLGLFEVDNKSVSINERFKKERRESLDDYTLRLPSICLALLFEEKNCHPLWEDAQVVAADFVRGVAWLFSQDIYGFPTAWGDVERIQNSQTKAEKKIFTNDTRWNGLRPWMRYLGLATGDSGSFQIDPTLAIKSVLPLVFESRSEMPGKEFLHIIATKLPVLDSGRYHMEVINGLNHETWRKPSEGHLSMALSLALRRLALDNVIRLEGKADAGSSYRLTGKNYRTWGGFEYVRWVGSGA